VLIDKTGTLTEGKARVARWHGEARALDLAGALESESSHPVARAFQASAARSLRVVRTIEDVIESPGRGIAGRVDCRDVRVGNRRHVETDGAVIGAELSARAAEMVADGLSPVFVALDGVVAGVAGVGDRVRDDARKTVETLRARGLAVRILSGDDARIVARVAEAVGVAADDALGGLTPEDKRDIVAGLVSAPNRLGTVVMVGDGVNDAAALVLADVGVAVHGGMGATIVAADVVLTREGIAPLVEILDGARRLAGVVHRNIGFSLVYNVAASSLAAAGLIGPLAGAILMPLSSLTVVMSSAFTRSFSLGAGRAAPSSRQGQGA
jgi:Cu2+-exporting ATPase